VAQADWSRPVRSLWLERLAEAVENAPGAILVGHSLGCALIADLAGRYRNLRIGGALLVAPADSTPQLRELAPMPAGKLPFPTVVVASMNDPFMTIERARFLATAWGAGLVNAGVCGHINVAAGFGAWPAGEKILHELASECRLHARGRQEARRRAVFEPDIPVSDPELPLRSARPSWLFRSAQDDRR
jgi:predicted alpha/beta hydrolase family esterase